MRARAIFLTFRVHLTDSLLESRSRDLSGSVNHKCVLTIQRIDLRLLDRWRQILRVLIERKQTNEDDIGGVKEGSAP